MTDENEVDQSKYEPIDFSDLEPIEIPVRNLGDHNYILAEASGDSAAKFKNMMLNNTELVDGKPSKVLNYGNVEAYLVHLCIRYAGDREEDICLEDKPVPLQVVKKWPSRVVHELFIRAKDISELDEDDDDEKQAKNEQSDTTDGSDLQNTAV